MVFFCLLIIFAPRTKTLPLFPTESAIDYDYHENSDYIHIPVPGGEEILLDDESVKVVSHVSDAGIVYEEDEVESPAKESREEILLQDGSSKFFQFVSDDGMLYDEMDAEGKLISEESSEGSAVYYIELEAE